MSVVAVNAAAAAAMRPLGVPVRVDDASWRNAGGVQTYEVPLWGLHVWALKERWDPRTWRWHEDDAAEVAGTLAQRCLRLEEAAAIELVAAADAALALAGPGAAAALCASARPCDADLLRDSWRSVPLGRGAALRGGRARRGPFVWCVPDGAKVRVRAASGGYDPELRVEFPRRIRVAGHLFEVDRLWLRYGGRDREPYYKAEGMRPFEPGSP